LETNETRNPETNPETKPETEPEAKLQPNNTEHQPPEELDDLQTKVRDLPESKWNLYQTIGGAVTGAVCGYLLTELSSYPSIGMYGTIGAALLALFGPRLVEKRVKRTVQKARIWMMIALGVWLLAKLLFMLISGVPILNK
jgi:hypothetical protein